MGKIKNYETDSEITSSDKLLGSDSGNNFASRNFTVGDLYAFMTKYFGKLYYGALATPHIQNIDSGDVDEFEQPIYADFYTDGNGNKSLDGALMFDTASDRMKVFIKNDAEALGGDWVDATTGTLNIHSIILADKDQAFLDAMLAGQFAYSSDDDTLVLKEADGSQISLGQEHVIKYIGGSTGIPEGYMVMYGGSVGGSGKIIGQKANSTSNGSFLFGVARQTVGSGVDGKATSMGANKTQNIAIPSGAESEFSSWVVGDVLYQSVAYPGFYQRSVPPAKNNKIPQAVVTKKAGNNIELLVRVSNALNLEQISNIDISGVANGDLFIYDSASGVWKNSKQLTGGSYSFSGSASFALGISALSASISQFLSVPSISAEEINTSTVVASSDIDAVGNITAGFNIEGATVKKTGGTNQQILLADGSVIPFSTLLTKVNSLYTPNGGLVAVYTDASGNMYINGALSTTQGVAAGGPIVNTQSNDGEILLGGGGTYDINDFMSAITTLYDTNGNEAAFIDASGNLHLYGSIYQNGGSYVTEVEEIRTSDNVILLRRDATVGLGVGEYAGLVFTKYDGVNDGAIYIDKDGVLRIGDIGSLQAVATRENIPTQNAFAYWDSTTLSFKTLSTEKTSVIDTDSFAIKDSSDSGKPKLFTFSNLKTALLNYFDGRYAITNGTNVFTEQNSFDISPTFSDDMTAVSQQGASVNKVASMVAGVQPATALELHPEEAYLTRVNADGGDVDSNEKTVKISQETLDLLGNAKFFWDGVLGNKNASGKVSKIYDLSSNNNDASQATSANQPYIGGVIAPNEVACLRFLDDTATQTYAMASSLTKLNTESLTLILALKLMKVDTTSRRLYFDTTSYIEFKQTSVSIIVSGATVAVATVSIQPGITQIIAWKYDNGKNVISLNGVNQTLTTNTIASGNIVFSKLEKNLSNPFSGDLYTYGVVALMSASDVLKHYKYLRSIHPEIETITIGRQQIATSNSAIAQDGASNSIGEVQYSDSDGTGSNPSPEKIAFGGFDDATNWTLASGHTISDSKLNISSVATTASYRVGALSVDLTRYYKITGIISGYVSGGINMSLGYGTGSIPTGNIGADGSFEAYLKAGSVASTVLYITPQENTTLSLDSLSIKEIGWTDAQNLYNSIYAQTSGTASVKDLAASKAAAMWCNYDNLATNGAIYGKLYNWWVDNLLKLNPIKNFRVMEDQDWYYLIAKVGTNPAYKLMATGNAYWNSASGTNEAGLTVLGAGIRDTGGSFATFALKQYGAFHTPTDASSTNGGIASFTSGAPTINVTNSEKIRGRSLRLISIEPAGADNETISTGWIANALGAGNLEIEVPEGYLVESININSRTGITGLSAKYCSKIWNTLAIIELNTLFTAQTVVANTPITIPTQVSQNTQRQGAIVRINGTKADTAEYFKVEINIKKIFKAS